MMSNIMHFVTLPDDYSYIPKSDIAVAVQPCCCILNGQIRRFEELLFRLTPEI